MKRQFQASESFIRHNGGLRLQIFLIPLEPVTVYDLEQLVVRYVELQENEHVS